MKRPERYPYTKSQWVEEITIVSTSDNGCFKLRVLENQLIGERK
jgi:hypothetical protein